jgi:hypothetical protein
MPLRQTFHVLHMAVAIKQQHSRTAFASVSFYLHPRERREATVEERFSLLFIALG